MIIGISGTLGSGKDTVAKYIESKGFEHISTSDVLRDINKRMGLPLDRESLRKNVNALRQVYDAAFLVYEALKKANSNNVVLSGIRNPGEIDYLKSRKDSFVFFVDAPIEIRYQRVSSRKRDSEDLQSFEEFKKQEETEKDGASTQVLNYCKEAADEIIINSGTVDQLEEKVDQILTKLEK